MVVKQSNWLYKSAFILMVAYYSGVTDAFLPFVDDRVFLFGGSSILFIVDILIIGDFFSTKRIKVFDSLYFALYFCIILLCATYTVESGYAKALHVVTYATSCVLPLLLLPLLYTEWNGNDENCCWIEIFVALVGASMVLRMLNCLIFELSHIAIIPNVLGVVRGGHATARVYALDVVLFFIELYRASFNYRETKRFNIDAYICLTVLIFFTFFARGRMQILCLIGSIIFFFLFQRSKGGDKLITYVVLIVASLLFLMTPYSKDLITTATGASSEVASINFDGTLLFQGTGDNTASIRLFSINHGWEMMGDNLNGMGLVYYGSQRFREFFPIGSNDDLGYIGTIFTFGFAAVLLIAPLIVWGIKQCLVVRRQSLFPFRFAIVVYLILTGISLSLFDLSRIGALPFFIYLLSTSSSALTAKQNSDI